MKILRTISRVPGGLMVVPLMLGAQFDTIDQMHVVPVQHVLKALGAAPNDGGHYEFLRVGGFVEALFKTGALTLIGLFLFCAASQIAGVAEASTAGNAAATPAAVAAAALLAEKTGAMSAEQAHPWQEIAPPTTVQVSISTLATAVLCPLAVILWYRYQTSRGIDSRLDDV